MTFPSGQIRIHVYESKIVPNEHVRLLKRVQTHQCIYFVALQRIHIQLIYTHTRKNTRKLYICQIHTFLFCPSISFPKHDGNVSEMQRKSSRQTILTISCYNASANSRYFPNQSHSSCTIHFPERNV